MRMRPFLLLWFKHITGFGTLKFSFDVKGQRKPAAMEVTCFTSIRPRFVGSKLWPKLGRHFFLCALVGLIPFPSAPFSVGARF